MAMIPVAHITEKTGDILFPWLIRCQKCGCEVARISKDELTAMVNEPEIEPIFCWECEKRIFPVSRQENTLPQNDPSPYPCISVPKRFLGFI